MSFKNPGVTADIIIEKDGEILLVKRKHNPFRGMWALPGGYLDYGNETVEETAIREGKEETNLNILEILLLGVYSTPRRDPRGHTVSLAYIATRYEGEEIAGDDAKEVCYFPLKKLPPLAFDHIKVVNDYIEWRKNEI